MPLSHGGHVTAPSVTDLPGLGEAAQPGLVFGTKSETMKHSPLTAASLIALREAQQRGEERAGPIIVHDLALASEPERSVMFDPNRASQPWSSGRSATRHFL